MTTSTHTELMNIAKQTAAYINRLNGECDPEAVKWLENQLN